MGILPPTTAWGTRLEDEDSLAVHKKETRSQKRSKKRSINESKPNTVQFTGPDNNVGDAKDVVGATIAELVKESRTVVPSYNLPPTEHVARPVVYMDIQINDTHLGRIVYMLFADITPITCENFRVLCTGERGFSQSGTKLHFKGSSFHRVMPGFMAQGGDIVNFDGTGTESAYGGTFRDENFKIKHKKAGMLSMANSKKHTNGSQVSSCCII